MLTPINNVNSKRDVFRSFNSNPKNRYHLNSFMTHRYRNREAVSADTKIKVAIGSLAGTIAPVLAFAKHKKVSPFKLQYGLKEMIGVGVGGVLGGMLTGVLADKKERSKAKLEEGVFQLLNVILPPVIALPLLKVCKSNKKLNNIPATIVATLVGLGAGMYGAIKLSNKINDPKDKVPDRKLNMLDAMANVDEAFGVFVLAKFPCLKNIPVEKALPFIYSLGGYRTGTHN